MPNKPLFNDEAVIFLITPTYTRPTQMPDMTRLAQTLRLVPNVFWIVVEDSHNESKYAAFRFNLMATYHFVFFLELWRRSFDEPIFRTCIF